MIRPRAKPSAEPRPVVTSLRPTYAEIDCAVLARNLRAIHRRVGEGCRVLAVVKADAYGHGAAEASRAFIGAGAWGLAVSLVEEGIELREAGIHAPIVILGGVTMRSVDAVVHRRLTPVVWSHDHLEGLAAAVRRVGARPLPVHLKIDTGMSRLGALPEDLPSLLEWLQRDGGRSLVPAGVMTHFASADEIDDDLSSARQLGRFRDCLAVFAARGIDPGLRHACNSAALARYPEAHFDMVRPGIALYGSASCPPVELDGLSLAMSVRSRILGLRDLPSGVSVSYGGRHRLVRDSRLAIVPVGYADGYPRSMSGQAQMLVRGHRCRVLGNITMDMCMLDVTDIPGARVGEEVTLLGRQGAQCIDLYELSAWASTIPHEIPCGVSKRVPRRFTEPAVEPPLAWE